MRWVPARPERHYETARRGDGWELPSSGVSVRILKDPGESALPKRVSSCAASYSFFKSL
jgi:hypothetical protein